MRSTLDSKQPSLAFDGSRSFWSAVAVRTVFVLSGALGLSSCGASERTEEDELELAGGVQALARRRAPEPAESARETIDPARPADDYTLFEADPVRPVAVLAASGLVVVANTVDDSIELLEPTGSGVERCGSVKVGMRPVAVAAVRESRHEAELWVVNHISDSISVVSLNVESCRGQVIDTLYTGDEPRDIVVTKTRSGQARVFVAAAHRGQHHPIESARLGTDLITPPEAKESRGLADVFVFDPRHRGAEPRVINLFTEVPRALAVGSGVVYAAGFRTGNRTTAVHAERAAQRGVDSLSTLLATDAKGDFIERDGELVLSRRARGRSRIEGGMPAVVGQGRCMPDPRLELRERFIQQVCVETDREHRVQKVLLEREGEAHPSCRCTSGDGTLQPTTAVIVKFFDRRSDCGRDYRTFPDGTRGCWLDAEPGGVQSPAARAVEQAPPMAWNDDVKLSLPDTDVFAISVDDLRTTRDFSGVGTVLFGMAVQPGTGRVFVTNTEAQNLTRFEGEGANASTTVRGHLHESRVTVIDPAAGKVRPVHLNGHIDYARCCERREQENESSFAFPTAGVFSADGARFYFSALGSDSIGAVDSSALVPGFDNLAARRDQRLMTIRLGAPDAPVGPVGLELDRKRQRLYVKTFFTNELVVVDTALNGVIDRAALPSPEPESIRAGREVFYDARQTSSHGDSACASCHVFGDFDGISWDLGDPDGETVNNPGPQVLPAELVSLAQIAANPFAEELVARPREPDFRSNKGPMSTQTLRGLANHGAMHWRGDRTRHFQNVTGAQPDVGSMDENSSFNEFDVAIQGLNGNDRSLEPEVFQAFTDFTLQLTLPPNPVRALDNTLTPAQTRARAVYFGCSSLTDAQLERRECIALDGARVDIDTETQSCRCASNPLLPLLRDLPKAQGMGRLLQAVFADAETSAAFDRAATHRRGLTEAAARQLRETFAAFRESREALLGASLELDPVGLIAFDAALALAGTAGGILQLGELSADHHTRSDEAHLGILEDAIEAVAPGALGDDGLAASLEGTLGLANLDLRTAADEAARGTGEFHNLRQGCSLTEPAPVCRLRVTDSFETCNGCHTLDAKGNADRGVYRPGFFGTSGEYSFENISQIFKVPHLRNMYQKAGMFGMPLVEFVLPESVLGPLAGGFFAKDNAYLGPQVRGYGYMHDGAVDTLHRFHGAAVFAARSAGTLAEGDPGNAAGFEVVVPDESERGACIATFRGAPASVIDGAKDPELRSALGLCLAGSPVPDHCFHDTSGESCQAALDAIGEQLGQSGFALAFAASIRPACFQLGSMLQQGSPSGSCAPPGLKERVEMEAYMFAFDSNLAPMVGQQLTLHGDRLDAPLLAPMLRAAAAGQCDIALRQNDRGYLMTEPNGRRPEASQVADVHGTRRTLAAMCASQDAITLTCFPPHPRRAEARRSAFGAAGG